MFLNKQNRLMLIFLDERNPLWEKLLPASPGKKNKSIYGKNSLTGAAEGSVSGWRHGESISETGAKSIFDNVEAAIRGRPPAAKRGRKRKALQPDTEAVSGKDMWHRALTPEEGEAKLAMLAEFAKAFDREAGIRDVAEILSMDINLCRKIADESIFKLLPLLPTIYRNSWSEKPQAKNDEENCGMYRLAVKRNDEWLICALHVRYMVEIGEGLALRCKLTAPDILRNRKSHPLEYDGFLTVDSQRMFWMFEKRAPDRKDFFYLITDPGHAQNCVTHVGWYLTPSQEFSNLPMTGIAFLEALDIAEPKAQDEFMANEPMRILGAAHCAPYNQRLMEIQGIKP